jgi:Sortilin, neurotensin receptor 3,
MITSLLLGAQIGTRGAGQRTAGRMAEVIWNLLFQVTGVNYLSDLFSFTTISLDFSPNGDGISIDPETGKIRISSQQLMDGIELTVTAFDANGKLSGQFDLVIALKDSDAGVPAVPVSKGGLDDVMALIGSGLIAVDAATDFTGGDLTFTLSGAGATIDSASGLVTIATDALLSDEKITVTASNASGHATSTFQVTVGAVAPVMTAKPNLKGNGKIGAPVTVELGTWDGKPAPELDVQWLLGGAEIKGAKGTEYTPLPADDLKTLSCRVTATNAGGSAKAVTNPLTITHTAPELVGILADVSVGKGAPTVSVEAADVFEGEALRFSVIGAGATIDDKTGVISIPTNVAMAATEVVVTAENSGGTAEVVFEVTIATLDILPLLLSAPALTGKATIGQALTLDQGLWGGLPAPELALQWFCDGADIKGETGPEYTPVPEDDLKTVSCRVTATNTVGSAEAVTDPLTVTYAAPVAARELSEEVFDQNTGVQKVETAQDFTGQNLSFVVEGANANIDARTGIVSIPTNTAFEGGVVTVSASNSGGTARSEFMVTVEAGTGALLPLADDEWEIVECAWMPAGQAVTYQPKVRIDSGVGVHAAQWTTSGYDPALDEHWETLAPVAGESDTFVTEMLHKETGDWHLFQQGQTRSANFRIRYKTSEAGEWSERSGKKEILPPSSGRAPAAITDWTVVPGNANGQIVVTIEKSVLLGEDAPSGVQWHNAHDGWQDILSATFSYVLDKSLHGLAAEILVRAVGETGLASAETSNTVKVPGKQAVLSNQWQQFAMMSNVAYKDPKTYFYPGGGFHRQYFHGGDSSPVNPDHAMLVMDVHGPWVVPNATARNPGLYTPSCINIAQRNGVSVKFDPEIEKRAIIAITTTSGSNGAGLYLTEDLAETSKHVLETAIPGGSYGGYSGQYRAWRQLICYDRSDTDRWLFAVPQWSSSIGAVFRSTDRGKSWSQVSTHPRTKNMGRIYVLQQAANNSFIICAENGLYRSTDNGANWNLISRPNGLPSGDITGMALHPTDTKIAYIAVYGKGVYRTEDNFASVHGSKQNSGLFCAVFAHPLNFDNVWAIGLNRGLDGSIKSQQSQFSRNGGSNWTRLRIDATANGWDLDRTGYQNANVPGFDSTRKEMQGGIIPILSGPEDALMHFSTKHFKSNGDGAYGEWAGLSADTHGSGEANWGNVIFSPVNPDRFMIGAFDEGFFETTNAGRSFVQVHRGNGGAGGNSGGQSGGYSSSVEERFIGTSGDYTSQTAPVHRKSAGGSFQTNALFIKDTTGGIPRYTFASYSPASNGGSHIATNHYVSTDNGSSWTNLANQSGWPGGGYFAQVCLMSYQDAAVIYAVNDAMTGLWRSSNFGKSWSKYVDFGVSLSANAQPQALAIDPFDHDVVYWWMQGQGLVRYDGSSKSVSFKEVSGMRLDRVRVSKILPGVIYLWRRSNGGDGVWRSIDGGKTVENISYNMPRTQAVRSIEECPWTGILFMVGTIGPRYFAPPSINARCAERLALYKEIMRDPRSTA